MSVPAQMSAVRWHGAADIRLDRVPVPELRAGQVLIEVEACGVCGTDVAEARTGPHDLPVGAPHPLTGARTPLTLGHEVLGRVIQADPRGPQLGTRVIPDVVLGCGECWWCRRHREGICAQRAVRGLHIDGGLAQYMVADAATLITVPDTLPAAEAVLAEPLSVAVRALRKAGDLSGSVALVSGLGTIGHLVARLLVRRGVRVIASDPDPQRRRLAEILGVVALAPEGLEAQIAGLERGGVDVAFECSGAGATAEAAFAATCPGGLTVVVGEQLDAIGLDPRRLVVDERAVVGTAAHLWDEDVLTAVRLLEGGLLRAHPVPTQAIDLAQAVEFLVTGSAPDGVLKVFVQP